MFGNSKLAVTLVAMSVSTMAATTAQAVLVTVNGTTVFEDGFEGVTPGANANPTLPGPGTWINQNETGGSVVEVVGPAGTGPGAAFGNNYYRINRSNGGDASAQAQFSTPAGPGDTIHAEWYTWISDAADFSSGLLLGDGNNWGVATTTTGSPKSGSPGAFRTMWLRSSGYDLTDLGYTPDTWQKWEIDWVVGSDEATFTVNGVSQVRNDLPDVVFTSVDRLYFIPSGGYENFYDGTAVPEPTMALLVSAAAVLSLRRRRPC